MTQTMLEQVTLNNAEQMFRERMGPLLALGDKYPDASDLFIDGEHISLRNGNELLEFGFSDFPGMSPRRVQAAGANAAVFAGVEFGSQPPAMPLITVKIPPDLRVTYATPPAAEKWHVDIRFLRSRRLTLEDYVASGIMTDGQADQLRELIDQHKTVLISGSTSSGKTTLLRTLLELAAGSGERMIIIEDTPEISIVGPRIVQLHTALNVKLDDLLRISLRLTPDRLVVGEVRGTEALELVRAMNTGHDGVLCTLHSNGAEEALRRLHTLVSEAQPNYPLEAIRMAVDYVVQLTGMGSRRKLTDIWKVPK